MNEFKKKRIEMELSITDVVNDLKYPTSTIEAIEKNEYNFMPQPYLYYCIKAYGTYLKILNLDDILENIKKNN
jgi:cytoskeletal protein RodZ